MCLAVPGKILETKEENGSRLGRVQFGGITRLVQLDFVPEAGVGDYVIVHVGFALSKSMRRKPSALINCSKKSECSLPMNWLPMKAHLCRRATKKDEVS